MRTRLPLVLSSLALFVAVLGSTPLGHAAQTGLAAVVPFATKAGFAENAGKLNGHRSSTSPTPGQIPVVRRNGKLPASLGAVGLRGPQGTPGAQGAAGPQGATGQAGVAGKNGATKVVVREARATSKGFNTARVSCSAGEVAVGGGGFGGGYELMMSQPSPITGTPTGWWVAIDEGTVTTTVIGYAICASP